MNNAFIITFKTTLAMMKRKKVQSILIGIVIMLISTLLYMGLSMVNQGSPAVLMFERANATENMLINTDENVNIDTDLEWWNNRDEVEGTIVYDKMATSATYSIDDKTESSWITVTEYVENSEYDLLYVTDKVLSEAPVDNEMLINYNFAKNKGLELGDKISFLYEDLEYEFEVAGFVVDSQFNTPFMSSDRCYVEPGFFENNNMVNSQIIGIKYKDIEKVNDYNIYEQFLDETKSELIYIGYDSLLSSYNIISGIMASILLGVSVFIFVIVIFVIRSAVRNVILIQYKQIGVKKVLGYTSKQIRKSFLWMYSILGFIASIAGSLIGIPIRNMVNKGISNDMQIGIEAGFDLVYIVTVIIVVLLIVIFTSMATKQANQIQPVQAIKYGMPESKISVNKFNISKSKRIPLSILLAVKQMLVNKKKTIMTTITITLLIYVAFFINSSAYSLADSDNFLSHLTGTQVGDFTVENEETTSSADFIDKLESIESIECAVGYEISTGESVKGNKDDEIVPIISENIYGDYPEDGIIIASGRQPENDFEIIITSEIMEKTGKTIGDYLTVTKNEEEINFFISGIYNSINNNGMTYVRIIKEVPVDKIVNSSEYWVYTTEEHVIIDEMEKKISDLVDDEIIVTKYGSANKNILSTIEDFPMVMKSLLFVFLLISGVIILNFTIMDIHNSTRAFGVMKATGYSTSSIIKMMIIKSVLLTSVGVVLGFVLNLLTANMIMQAIFSLTPFSTIKLPILFDVAGSLIMMVLFVAIAVIATFIPARRISEISPKILMTE